jgi:hypothetical protein
LGLDTLVFGELPGAALPEGERFPSLTLREVDVPAASDNFCGSLSATVALTGAGRVGMEFQIGDQDFSNARRPRLLHIPSLVPKAPAISLRSPP